MTQAHPSRNWCFTLNNPVQLHTALAVTINDANGFKYLVFQKEKGEDGTIHFQGYVQFSSNYRLSGVKKLLPRAHWEKRKGNHKQARDYCMKEDTRVDAGGPWEYGVNQSGGRGARTDLSSFVADVQKGMTDAALVKIHPNAWLRYNKSADRLRLQMRPERKDVQVMLAFGKPGTGKTTTCINRAIKQSSPGDLWTKPLGSNLWFDGYCGQRFALIDDFFGAASHITLPDTLQLLHEMPEKVAIKGSFVWWTPSRVMVTTNHHPMTWFIYDTRPDSYEALKRRFHSVYWFRKEKEPVRIDSDKFFDDYVEFADPARYCIPVEEEDVLSSEESVDESTSSSS